MTPEEMTARSRQFAALSRAARRAGFPDTASKAAGWATYYRFCRQMLKTPRRMARSR